MKKMFKSEKMGNISERGSVLVIALVILVVLTLMAIAGVQSTSVQERMAGNIRDKDISFQSAEAALRDAELALRNDFEALAAEDCFYPFDDQAPGTNPDLCNHLLNTSFPSTPQFFIRELPPIPEPVESLESDLFQAATPSLYRITAESAGGTADAVTILQSIYKR